MEIGMKEKDKNGRYKDKYGTVRWYKDGQFHREDGPAVEWNSGTKSWYLNDKLHREDGPAIEWSDGRKEWWLNDIQHTEEEFNQWLEKKHLNEKLLATLDEKPSVKKVKI